jgi:hypothetical protein
MGDLESPKYEDEAEEHIAFVAKNAVPKVANDPTLQAVMSAVRSGCCHKPPPNVPLQNYPVMRKLKNS